MTSYYWESLTGFIHYFQIPVIWFGLAGLLAGLSLFWFLMQKIFPFATSPERAGPGCLTQILDLLFQTLLVALFVLLLLPVLLGQGREISWQAVEPLGFVAIRSSLLAMILVTLISFIPWLGKWLAGSPGLEAFLLAVLTFRWLSPLYLEALVGQKVALSTLYPGVWDSLAYLLAALLLTRLSMVATFPLRKHPLLGVMVDILAGILPFLMYAHGVAQRVASQ